MRWIGDNEIIISDTDDAIGQEEYGSGDIRFVATTSVSRTPVAAQLQPEHYESPDEHYFTWAIIREPADLGDAIVLSSGMRPFSVVRSMMENIARLQQRQRERVAGVALDETASSALEVLNRETSLRWDELHERIRVDWPALCRGISLLAAADMCEVGPIRVRLSEYADRLLSER